MSRRKGYVPTLDGWRALSVIGVILYHGRYGFFRNSILLGVAKRGNLGVDVFFAISGFLICGLLLKEYERDGSISLRGFYLRRCFRILPAYYVALAGICLVSRLAAIPINNSDLPSCLLFYRNYKPLGMDEYGGFFTAHYWSLAVEEHFYLIWPILLIAVKPKHAGRVAFLLAMAVLGWRVVEMHFHWLSVILPQEVVAARTDTRLDGLLWGCLAAIYFPAIQRKFAGIRFSQLWLPIAALLIVVEFLRLPGLLFWHAILAPALVLSTILQPASGLARILEWRFFRWVGSLSYGLYLWQELFVPQMPSEMAKGAFGHLQAWPWNVAAMIVCAVLSRYLVEGPMMRLGNRLRETKPDGKKLSVKTPFPRPVMERKYLDIA